MELIRVLTQVEGVYFEIPLSSLRSSMVLPVSWNESNIFKNEGVINKTVFEKLKYMIINVGDGCCDPRGMICGDFREEDSLTTGIETKYVQGRIDDKTVEFILQIAK